MVIFVSITKKMLSLKEVPCLAVVSNQNLFSYGISLFILFIYLFISVHLIQEMATACRM